MSQAARYRRIYANEWHDAAFRTMNDAARVVRLYVSAGPQTTSVGCFRLSTAVAVEDLGGTAEAFEERLELVCAAFGWAWDPVARVVWITNWFDMNPPANPNVVNAWAKLLRNVPDCEVRTLAFASINRALKELPTSFREPWRELSKSFLGTESKAQSRTESIQGTGTQGFRESGSLGTGTKPGLERKRPGSTNGVHVDVSSRLLESVRAIFKQRMVSPNAELQDQIDALINYHNGIARGACTPAEARAALELFHGEQRATA